CHALPFRERVAAYTSCACGWITPGPPLSCSRGAARITLRRDARLVGLPTRGHAPAAQAMVEGATVAAQSLLQREGVGRRRAGHAVRVEQTDRPVRMDSVPGDGMAIGVRGVRKTSVVGDHHPARRNLMVGNRSIDQLELTIRQANCRHCSGLPWPPMSVTPLRVSLPLAARVNDRIESRNTCG